MSDRLTFDVHPITPVRLQMCAWLCSHGIDPSDVAVPGFIERREQSCQVVYDAHLRDDTGAIVLTPAGNDAERVVRVVQLEGRPLPFPPPTIEGPG